MPGREDSTPTAAPQPGTGSRASSLAMAGVALLAFAGVLVAGRRIDFFYDEWSVVLRRRAWSADALLQPHNEHISVLPVLAYKLLFELVGLGHHWVYRALLAVLHAGLGVAVFLLARRRVGDWAAVLAAALVLVMGRAAENIVWAFQIGFVGSVLFGLLAFVALDRADRRGDRLACAALVAATLCSSLGVPFAIGAGVEVALRRRRALWIPGVPIVLYAAWWLGYGRGTSTITRDSVVQGTTWALDAAASAAGGAVGLTADWGRVLLVALVAGLGWRILRGRPPLSPRLLGLIATAVAFWALTGAARSLRVDAGSSRYITMGAVLLLLIVVELARDRRPTRQGLVAGVALVVIAAGAGLPYLRDYSRSLRVASGVVDTELGALALVPGRAPAGYRPDAGLAPQLAAGPLAAAVRDLGSTPADSPSELVRAFNSERGQADRVLQDVALLVAPAPRPARDCRALGAAPMEVVVPPGGLLLAGDGRAAAQVRRFADDFANPPSPLPVRRATLLRFVPDRSAVPYRVRLSRASGVVRLCG